MNKPPCHGLDFKLVAHGPGDRRSEFAAGDGVSGKAEARELRKGFAPVCNAQQRGGEIGQIGPFMRHVERPRIGHAATAELLREHEIEPRSMAAPIKVPRWRACPARPPRQCGLRSPRAAVPCATMVASAYSRRSRGAAVSRNCRDWRSSVAPLVSAAQRAAAPAATTRYWAG